MLQTIPLPRNPQDTAPLHLFAEHPLLWWGQLSPMGRLAALVIVAGLATFAVGVWLGIRRRWSRMKRTTLPVDERPVIETVNVSD
jgi:hypothetical protein